MQKMCIACKFSLSKVGKVRGFTILKCLECGLGVTENFTSQKGDYHRNSVYILESDQFKNIFKRRIDLILNFLKYGKVLEIGSATGTLLYLLKNKGFEVLGIEPSIKTADYANSKGIKTLKTTFEEAKLPTLAFDFVVANHVLEHLDDPVGVLRKIKKILKDGGYVFIDVPNFGGIKAHIRGVNWEYLLPEEHKWHFTSESLERLLESNGFQVVYWEATSGIWDYASPPQELWKSLVGAKKRFFVNLVTAIPSWLVSKMRKGSGLIIIAQKR